MIFSNFDAVIFTVGFLVPGFVWSAVLAMIVPDRTSGEVRFWEAQFELLPNGEWAPVEDTGGVPILSDQIATIEFRKLTEENYDEQ